MRYALAMVSTLTKKDKGQTETAQAESAKRSTMERYPWERLDGESFACFSRFVLYRNTPPGSRSMRKLGVSGTTAFRWAKRWHWTERATAYDLWQLELSDGLANKGRLYHDAALVRFSSVSLSKAEATVAKLDETKLSADEAIALAVNGAKLGRQGLGISEGPTVADRAPSASVSVSLGLGQLGWAQPRQLNETKPSESNQKEVVVLAGEQVIAETPAGSGRPRLAERIVNCPVGKGRPRGKPNE